MTILLWGTFVLKAQNLKIIYEVMRSGYRHYFPFLPDYSSFLRQCHKAIPVLLAILKRSMEGKEIQFVDSTPLEVCKIYRANSHKVARGIAKFGKNHQGWHFGFKLHATVDINGKLCAVIFTPANVYDAQVLPDLALGNEEAKMFVGDGGYTARIMRERMWEEHGIFVLAPAHPKQKTKLAALWQIQIQKLRKIIETTFGVLKERFLLETHLPRSLNGFLLHYLRVLLTFQLSF